MRASVITANFQWTFLALPSLAQAADDVPHTSSCKSMVKVLCQIFYKCLFKSLRKFSCASNLISSSTKFGITLADDVPRTLSCKNVVKVFYLILCKSLVFCQCYQIDSKRTHLVLPHLAQLMMLLIHSGKIMIKVLPRFLCKLLFKNLQNFSFSIPVSSN